jgi:CubicO group peptidase (beta-lactamase class C family)
MRQGTKVTLVCFMGIMTTFVMAQSDQHTSKTVTAQHENAVEHNLLHQTAIRNDPEPGLSLLDQMSQLHVPGVSIAVIHNGKLEWAKGYGVTKLGGPPVSPDTVFNAASMTKPLTAIAVMRLVQEGKVDLDKDVNSYLRTWKIPENQYTVMHKVTVRELLSHTSGIGTHNGEVIDPDKGVPTMLQMLNGEKPSTSAAVRVEAEPGTKYAYANGGFLILQLLISDLTGESFPQYMQDVVLRPLGMSHSTFQAPLPASFVAMAATGYWENGVNGIAPEHFVKPALGAGGLWTTAPDYAKLIVELQREYAGKSSILLKRTTVRQMLIPGIGPSDAVRWGLGVRVGGILPKIYFEHGGSGVFQNDMVGYVGGDGVVVLTSGGGGGALVEEIVRSVARVYGWPDFKPEEHTVAHVDPSRYDRLVGKYDFIKVMKDGDDLVAEIPLGTRKQKLIPESDTRFFLRDGPTTIIFDENPDGRVTGLEFVTNIVHWHRDKTL